MPRLLDLPEDNSLFRTISRNNTDVVSTGMRKNRRVPAGIADYGGALGRDEMNLAEFPLAALADRVAQGQTTLVFEDTVWDKRAGQEVTRRLAAC